MGKRLRISCVYGFQISHVMADTVLNYLNVICLLNSNSALECPVSKLLYSSFMHTFVQMVQDSTVFTN